eukprot:843994-Rhodomonas_salina.1
MHSVPAGLGLERYHGWADLILQPSHQAIHTPSISGTALVSASHGTTGSRTDLVSYGQPSGLPGVASIGMHGGPTRHPARAVVDL